LENRFSNSAAANKNKNNQDFSINTERERERGKGEERKRAYYQSGQHEMDTTVSFFLSFLEQSQYTVERKDT